MTYNDDSHPALPQPRQLPLSCLCAEAGSGTAGSVAPGATLTLHLSMSITGSSIVPFSGEKQFAAASSLAGAFSIIIGSGSVQILSSSQVCPESVLVPAEHATHVASVALQGTARSDHAALGHAHAKQCLWLNVRLLWCRSVRKVQRLQLLAAGFRTVLGIELCCRWALDRGTVETANAVQHSCNRVPVMLELCCMSKLMPALSLVPGAARQLALPASSTSKPCPCTCLGSSCKAGTGCDACCQRQTQSRPASPSLDRQVASQGPTQLLAWTQPCRLCRPPVMDSW